MSTDYVIPNFRPTDLWRGGWPPKPKPKAVPEPEPVPAPAPPPRPVAKVEPAPSGSWNNVAEADAYAAAAAAIEAARDQRDREAREEKRRRAPRRFEFTIGEDRLRVDLSGPMIQLRNNSFSCPVGVGTLWDDLPEDAKRRLSRWEGEVSMILNHIKALIS